MPYLSNLDELMILKMFSEFLVSLHLLLFIIGGYAYDNYNSDFFLHFFSFLSPICIVLCYYFNACFVQNLYLTFYSYGTDYRKRLKLYKLTGIFIAAFTTLCSLIFNDKKIDSSYLLFSYYDNWTLGFIYLIGFFVFIYIFVKIYYILKINRDYYFGNFKNEVENESK